MDIDIIDGKICLNGRAVPGSEGFEVRTKGTRKSEGGQWVCTQCGKEGAKKIFYQASEDGGWVYHLKCDCGNTIEIEKVFIGEQEIGEISDNKKIKTGFVGE